MHRNQPQLPPRPPNFPNEVLGRCFGFVEQLSPGTTYGGSAPGSSWRTSLAAAPLALVCRSWYWEAQRELYKSVVLRTEEDARAFVEAVTHRPQLARWTHELVIGVPVHDDDDGDPPNDDIDTDRDINTLTTSTAMVHAVRSCPNLRRIHINPLHFSVREDLFDALADKPLQVALWAPPTTDAGLKLLWGEALLQPTDRFTQPHSTLWYLEVHSRVEHALEGTPGSERFAARLPSTFPSHSTPAPNLKTLILHFDLQANALIRLLSRCTSLETLAVYLEKRYTATDVHTLSDTLATIASSLKSITWEINPASEDIPMDPTPPFDQGLLPRLTALHTLSTTSTETNASVLRNLPPRIEILELSSFEEPGVFGSMHLHLAALHDSNVVLGSLRKLIVHDELSWWGLENVRFMKQACASRSIEFLFMEDVES